MLEEEAVSKELVGADATRFRAIAARANYLAADRPDIQYVVEKYVGGLPNWSRETGRS